MTTECDLQPGGDGSDECDAVMTAWWLTLCQVMGENPQTDAELEALMSAPWAQVACRGQFDLRTYRDRRRDGSIARLTSVKLQYAWINVEDWSLWYTGEVEHG
jgi:hypothetical protein